MNTYANVPENIWQDPHSTSYLPHGPSRSPLYPTLCPRRLACVDSSRDLPCLPANGGHQQETQGMEEKDIGVFIPLVPV